MNKSLSQNVLPAAPSRTFEALVTVQHREVRQIEVLVPGYTDYEVARLLSEGEYDDFETSGSHVGTAYIDGRPFARITGCGGIVIHVSPTEENPEAHDLTEVPFDW